jgi:O-antigen/teichoic acid export membrane protein
MTLNISLTLLVRFARIPLGLVTSVLTARFLGPDGRGNYVFVVTLAALIVQFGNLGLQSSNTYLVAKNRELIGGLLSNSIFAALLSIPLSGLVIWVASLSNGEAGILLWWAAGLAPASLFLLLGSNLLVGTGRIVLFNVFEFAYAALVVPLMLVAGLLHRGVGGMLLATVLAAWLASFGLLFVLVGPEVRIRFAPDAFRSGLRFATKAYLVALLGFLVLRANVFLLERLAGASPLGQYSIASQITDLLAVLPQSVALVLFPRLVADQEHRWSTLRRSAQTTALLIIGLCAAVAGLAYPFIAIVFGSAYLPAVPILLFLLPGVVILAVTTVLSQYLAARGLPILLVGAWAIALLVVTFTSSVLIPSFGGLGAAIGLTLAYAVLFILVSILTFIERGREVSEQTMERRPA